VAASLDHANVVPGYDAAEADGHVYIAMRFVDGTDLGAELGHGPMSLERAMTLAAQVVAAPDADRLSARRPVKSRRSAESVLRQRLGTPAGRPLIRPGLPAATCVIYESAMFRSVGA
jgi:serine/threonine protein kinase